MILILSILFFLESVGWCELCAQFAHETRRVSNTPWVDTTKICRGFNIWW